VADAVEAPWPGHLVGGANPTELDCHDETEDPRTNENAINWDASLVYALAAVYDPTVEASQPAEQD
jgi:endoglucanase